jgi:hypothetical protein
MLLFLLCAYVRADGISGANPALFSDPSAFLLELWVAEDSNGMELAAASPDCSALATAASIRGAARTCPPVLWLDEFGIGASVNLPWFATLVEDGVVRSVSAVVEVDRLLDEDGSAGAEKVLDVADCTDSCEA